ncbi:BtrH N-terminal domain-containing protein [Cryptosporangium aurantiacum]|uniref:Butirosin biosynthesis protein H, N-terminal n=1 Tax=Cryptosporangium aurantiacum TaxID=134849 RepID=A0A1M7TYB0_9ACTN|nr:BtrH N-terminal domain-containing protein [Cryptosporangium aurantiacum]SHN75643.1 Butirosin biosynthesis protein H, N-terminal [Cryptosporangium aurantiacum]
MILNGVAYPGGQHCETTALGALLRHEKITLSEPMLFGLGEGLGFVYWDAKRMDFPFLGGRTKPTSIVRTLADRLGLTLRIEETGSPRKAWRTVATALDAGRPVGLQLDSYHLDYFTTKVHFAGHVVALYGYDDTRAYLIDTAQQGGTVSTTLDSLARARSQRGPMAARHLSFTISGPASRPDLGDAIRAAVRSNAHAFLNPPIANLGHRGISKAAREVPRWLARSSDPARDLPRAAMLMERGGTGGSLFRVLYRDFLAESAALVHDLQRGAERYAEIVPLWSEVARLIAAAGESGEAGHLTQASGLLTELAEKERRAMQTLADICAV